MAKKKLITSLNCERQGDPVPRNQFSAGLSTGLGLHEFIARLLADNEELPPDEKHTDEMLRNLIVEEFPDQPSAIALRERRMYISHWRYKYNTGKLHFREVPEKKSIRYDVDGTPLARRGSALDWEKYPKHVRELYAGRQPTKDSKCQPPKRKRSRSSRR